MVSIDLSGVVMCVHMVISDGDEYIVCVSVHGERGTSICVIDFKRIVMS